MATMLSPDTDARLARFYPPVRAAAGAPVAEAHRFIEDLALPDEEPARCRVVLEQWLDQFPPAGAGDRVLVEQLTVASIEKERARQARTAILQEKVRTAAYRFDCEQQAEAEAAAALMIKSPAEAVARLNRTAAGTRYLIGRWERLKAIFDAEGTWYGQDRDEAMRLQGVRPGKKHLAESETAYLTYLYCLMAQPKPRPKDAEMQELGLAELMPAVFRDHDYEMWVPCDAHARRLLDELVTHELTLLRAREAWLRTHVEEPARATAVERARVLEGRELAVLRNEQIHDQLFHRAYQALVRSHARRQTEPARPRAPAVHDEPRSPRAALLTEAPPKTHRQAHTVFLDYHRAHRAALEDIAAEKELERSDPESGAAPAGSPAT
jgi:hypothetical protein